MLVCRPPAYPLLMRLLPVGVTQMLEAVKALCGHLPCITRFAFSIYTARWESFLNQPTKEEKYEQRTVYTRIVPLF